MVERAADLGERPALACVDHADARDEDDARRRFEHDVAFVFVFFKVLLVLLLVSGHALHELFFQAVHVVRVWRPIDEQRHHFGMNEVIRASRSHLRQFRGICTADESEHVVLVIEGKNHFLLSETAPRSVGMTWATIWRRTSAGSAVCFTPPNRLPSSTRASMNASASLMILIVCA